MFKKKADLQVHFVIVHCAFVCIRSTSRAVANSSHIAALSVGKDSPQSMVSRNAKGPVGPLSALHARFHSPLPKS